MQKYLFLPIVLSFSFFVQAQNRDTIPKQFESFFGSDCDEDTLILKSDRNSEIVFYKVEGRLIRLKNNKIKWQVDISSLSEEYPNESFCILQRGVEGKPRETVVFVYCANGPAKLAIRSMNGKIMSK